MKKWFAPVLVYSGVGLGLFFFRNAWIALLIFHLAIILSILIARPDISIKILFRSKDIKWILVSVLLCGSSGITLFFLWNKFGIAENLSVRLEAMGLNRSNWIAFITYFALINPFLEEYFWRGYLGSKTTNFTVSDSLYAGFHGLILINNVRTDMIMYSLTVLIFAGWFWRQIERADGGLLAPVLGHMAADFSILMAVYWRT